MKKRKGQYLVVEEVILFGIGLTILIGLIMTFNSVNVNISGPLQKQQLEEISNYVLAKVITLNQIGTEGSYITFTVPKEITGKPYEIVGSGNEVIVFTPDKIWINKTAPITVRGSIGSNEKNIVLIYTDEEIEIRGVSNY